jgi:hypothetical protein
MRLSVSRLSPSYCHFAGAGKPQDYGAETVLLWQVWCANLKL